MDFVDKELQCSECGASFIFSVADQEFHASRGYTHEPKRCTSCRESRRTQRSSYGGYRPQREMFPAVCAECGIETQVPFEPREGRPVYCSDCYNKIRTSDRR